MKLLLAIVVLAALGRSQTITLTPGTITLLPSPIVAATTQLRCTFIIYPGNGINVQCVNVTSTAVTDFAIALPVPANTPLGQFAFGGDSISWQFVSFPGVNAICQAAAVAGNTCWQVVANGTVRTGIF